MRNNLSVCVCVCVLAVDLDLAQDSAEQAAPAVGHAPRLDEDVAALVTSNALHVDLPGEQRVVEARDVVAHVAGSVRLVVVLQLLVHVHHELVEVLHVLSERRALFPL